MNFEFRYCCGAATFEFRILLLPRSRYFQILKFCCCRLIVRIFPNNVWTRYTTSGQITQRPKWSILSELQQQHLYFHLSLRQFIFLYILVCESKIFNSLYVDFAMSRLEGITDAPHTKLCNLCKVDIRKNCRPNIQSLEFMKCRPADDYLVPLAFPISLSVLRLFCFPCKVNHSLSKSDDLDTKHLVADTKLPISMWSQNSEVNRCIKIIPSSELQALEASKPK